MARVGIKIRNRGAKSAMKMQGDVKDVCQALSDLSEEFKGWTVAAVMRYLVIVAAEEKQFEGGFYDYGKR